jgi:hypothetical protein
MRFANPIYLVYTPQGTNHVKYDLYWMLRGDVIRREWEIDRKSIAESGFELVHDTLGDGLIPNAATFHHHPSGSSVLVEDDHFQPSVKIFGERNAEAKDALVSLVRPYGFELRESQK